MSDIIWAALGVLASLVLAGILLTFLLVYDMKFINWVMRRAERD